MQFFFFVFYSFFYRMKVNLIKGNSFLGEGGGVITTPLVRLWSPPCLLRKYSVWLLALNFNIEIGKFFIGCQNFLPPLTLPLLSCEPFPS